MLDAGVTVALATDLNPGTTCSENLAMLGTIACIHMDMSPMEVLASVTRGAARSLKREGRLGSLAPGFQADVVVFDAPDVDYLFYHYGVSHVQQVLKKGAFVWHNPL
jgi:imidazolonepropionase